MSDNIIDNSEFEAAVAAAEVKKDLGVYTHKFKIPFTWGEQVYETLDFDFARLTGRDALAIETELAQLGKAAIIPAMSGDYLMRMASRASGLASDAFLAMSISDYNRIRSRARSFLLSTEL